jgi:membrane protease YdiL (CAAX protease family)
MALVAIAAAYSIAAKLGIDPMEIRRQMDSRFLMTPGRAVAAVLYLFTVNAALEELHFRAWMDRELSTLYGNAVGMTVSASAFAAMHLLIFRGMPGATFGPLAIVFLSLAAAGFFWSVLARRPGGIHAAWLSHGLTDALLLTWGLKWLGYF